MRYTLDNAIGPTRPWEALPEEMKAAAPVLIDDYNPETGECDSFMRRQAYLIRVGFARPMAISPAVDFDPAAGHVMMDLPLTGYQRNKIDQALAARIILADLLSESI